MAISMNDMRSFALGVTGDTSVKITDNGAITAGVSPTTDVQNGIYNVSKTDNGTYNLLDTTGKTVATSTDGLTYTNAVDSTNTIIFTEKVTSGQVTVAATGATGNNTITGANARLQAGTYTYDAAASALKDAGGNVVATTGDGQTFKVGANTVLTLTADSTLADKGTVTIHGVDVSNKAAASSAITKIQKALDSVSAQRSNLSAYQNRLEHTIVT